MARERYRDVRRLAAFDCGLQMIHLGSKLVCMGSGYGLE